MAKTQRTDAQWITIDVDTLTPHIGRAYEAYKAAYKAMKDARAKFEEDMALEADLPVGKRLVFGYNFGKLSVAVVEDDRKPVAKAGAQSLSSYLASMQVKGR
jgi:hypothetical protein